MLCCISKAPEESEDEKPPPVWTAGRTPVIPGRVVQLGDRFIVMLQRTDQKQALRRSVSHPVPSKFHKFKNRLRHTFSLASLGLRAAGNQNDESSISNLHMETVPETSLGLRPNHHSSNSSTNTDWSSETSQGFSMTSLLTDLKNRMERRKNRPDQYQTFIGLREQQDACSTKSDWSSETSQERSITSLLTDPKNRVTLRKNRPNQTFIREQQKGACQGTNGRVKFYISSSEVTQAEFDPDDTTEKTRSVSSPDCRLLRPYALPSTTSMPSPILQESDGSFSDTAVLIPAEQGTVSLGEDALAPIPDTPSLIDNLQTTPPAEDISADCQQPPLVTLNTTFSDPRTPSTEVKGRRRRGTSKSHDANQDVLESTRIVQDESAACMDRKVLFKDADVTTIAEDSTDERELEAILAREIIRCTEGIGPNGAPIRVLFD